MSSTKPLRYFSPQAIENVASGVRHELSKGKNIDVVESILEEFNCETKTVTFAPSNVISRLSKTDDGFIFEVAASKSSQSRRFLAARAGAHLLLHEKASFPLVHFSKALDAPPENMLEEVQASSLAAALVISRPEFMQAWRKSQRVSDISKYLNVSSQAVYWRMTLLDLRD